MQRSRFLWIVIVVAGVGMELRAAEGRRPNVVILLADDAGWGDYSINGNTTIHTPHIDSIGHEGAQFEQFYVSSLCSPTRAEFLTGRYHPRVGVLGVYQGQERMNLGETTIAEVFKAGGYATGIFGKWHNGSQWPYHPMARGFDEFVGYTAGHWGEYFNPPLEDNGRMVRSEGYIVDALTDRALRFIEENHREPFFCYVPFTTPHTPWAVPQGNWSKWHRKELGQFATQPEIEEWDQTRCALAMVENQDANVGRILEKLEQLGLRDDTIVIYFSDNGPNTFRWNGGMKGKKGTIDEGGLRSPLLVRWPNRIKAGTVIPEIAGAIDLMPTLSALARLPLDVENPLDGVDLSRVLMGQEDPRADRMIFSMKNDRVSVRTSKYRLDEKGALFDMRNDPGQRYDRSEDERAVAIRLRDAVREWEQQVSGHSGNASLVGQNKKAAKAKDNRPFTVGYAEYPWTPLPARDGIAHGNVQRSARAPNSSYFVNWISVDDRITWDVEVNLSGIYDVMIEYTCPHSATGATVELSFGESKLSGRVESGWDPPLYENQDTLPRAESESRMKEFRPLKLGSIRLERGRGMLSLRATDIPAGYVMDLRRLNLTYQRAESL